MIESGLALIACCFPTIYSLIKHKASLIKKLSQTSKQRGSSNESTGQLVPAGATIDSQVIANLDTTRLDASNAERGDLVIVMRDIGRKERSVQCKKAQRGRRSR